MYRRWRAVTVWVLTKAFCASESGKFGEKMNKTVKILLISVGGLMVLCLCLGVVSWVAFRSVGQVLSRSIDSDPVKVATISEEIVGYTLPDGFEEGYAVEVANFALVSHTAVNGRTHITLMQAPAALSIDRAEMERQMSVASGRDQWSEVRVIETKPCQIRDQEAMLVISEGISHDGQRYRSASAVFDGNGGTALVNVSGPAENWDQALVDSFIDSLQ
jgi:membrane-bound inhibitor of C-type lysozyme